MHQPIEDTHATQSAEHEHSPDNWVAHTIVRTIAVAAILLPFLILAKHAGMLS